MLSKKREDTLGCEGKKMTMALIKSTVADFDLSKE